MNRSQNVDAFHLPKLCLKQICMHVLLFLPKCLERAARGGRNRYKSNIYGHTCEWAGDEGIWTMCGHIVLFRCTVPCSKSHPKVRTIDQQQYYLSFFCQDTNQPTRALMLTDQLYQRFAMPHIVCVSNSVLMSKIATSPL